MLRNDACTRSIWRGVMAVLLGATPESSNRRAILHRMQSVSGVILAGGMGRRMGGVEKALQPLRGRPLIEWAIDRFAPQVDELLLSANRELERYASYGLPVVRDSMHDEQATSGPLAGLLAAL